MGIFLRTSLSTLYGACSARPEADPLPELEIQYADYAVWQRQWIEGDILRQQAEYWKTTLNGAPALLELPADHPRPAQQDFAGAFAGLVLDQQSDGGLKELSRSRHNPVHDSSRRMGSAAGKALRTTGRGHRFTGGQPWTCPNRKPDRLFRQHTGAAHRSVRLAQHRSTARAGQGADSGRTTASGYSFRAGGRTGATGAQPGPQPSRSDHVCMAERRTGAWASRDWNWPLCRPLLIA